MYHIVQPDPHHGYGPERIDPGLNTWYITIDDHCVDSEWVPDFSAAISKGQWIKDEAPSLLPHLQGEQLTKAKDNKDEDDEEDEEEEEEVDDDEAADDEDEDEDSLDDDFVWAEVTLKSQEQLDKEFDGEETAWKLEEWRLNLVAQQRHFPKHKAGDENDEYAQLLKKMLRMCNVKITQKDME
ncbi:unnamed protein product [Clonostachys rosea f. rosea IK726]|uniref:Uncharacterized protein n=1 Tax=Clonostachys rosea f. rosea IK726 TaxID=1349383 RepID=A0ACA9UUH3_BIOOC|nr:unnamed protein product [Clonostachys rosea f. rosea IK726]